MEIDINRTIELVYSKTLLLLDRVNILQQENQGLKKELNLKKEDVLMMTQKINEKEQEIRELNEKLDALNVTNAIKSNEVEKDTKVKEKINHLITEVDKCISLLSN